MATFLLLGVAAMLLVTLVELVQSRKQKDYIIKRLNAKIDALFAECNALEDKAQAMIGEYENECD